MPPRQDELEQRMGHFEAVLKRKGVKRTHQRMIIFEEVAESEEHPNAEAVFKAVRKRLPTVSLDTVYRTLWMLQDFGLIQILGARDRVRFDGNIKPHHHFVCSECGLMRDFHSSEFDRLKIPQEALNFGDGKTVHIEVKGICADCLKKVLFKSKGNLHKAPAKY